jgi:hypothetical protein
MSKRNQRLWDVVTWLLLLAALALLLVKTASAQGNGCPAYPPRSSAVRTNIVASVLLAPAVPYSEAAGGQARGTFYQAAIDVDVGAGWQALLASTSDGSGDLCVDDYFEIRAQPSGLLANHDFRDQAISRSEPIAPINLTYLLQPGPNRLEVTLIDLTGPAYSSSPLYLVFLDVPPTPTATPTARPTDTPTPAPTATATATVTPRPTMTPTAIPPAAPPPADGITAWLSFPFTPSPWLLLPLALAKGLLLLASILVWRRWRRPRPNGELELYEGERYVQTVDLGQLGRAAVTIGRQGDVALAGVTGPEIAARIHARRSRDGSVETILDLLDEREAGGVAESRRLHDGEELRFPPYRLIYRDYVSEEEGIDPLGEYTHA